MKVLTFGASPYIKTNLGRINNSLLKNFKQAGLLVASAVWDHDLSWYLPDNDRYYFEEDGERICQIYPFDNVQMEASSKFMYDIIFALNPDVIVTSGDIDDMEYTFAIKSLYPEKFKWIAYLAIPSLPINENKIEQLKMIDEILVSTKAVQKELEKYGLNPVYCPFGPNDAFSKNVEKYDKESGIRTEHEEKLNIIVNAKNSTVSNLGAVFMIARCLGKEYTIYLHTNYSDPGEFDLDLLKSRYDINDIISFPEEFVGLNEGISDEDLALKYAEADIVLDLSARSATGLCVLEAMRAGAIPLVSKIGALKEIDEEMSTCCSVDGTMFLSYGEKELNIVDWKKAVQMLINYKYCKDHMPKNFESMRKDAKKVSNNFSEKELAEKMCDSIKRIFSKEHEIKVETF